MHNGATNVTFVAQRNNNKNYPFFSSNYFYRRFFNKNSKLFLPSDIIKCTPVYMYMCFLGGFFSFSLRLFAFTYFVLHVQCSGCCWFFFFFQPSLPFAFSFPYSMHKIFACLSTNFLFIYFILISPIFFYHSLQWRISVP